MKIKIFLLSLILLTAPVAELVHAGRVAGVDFSVLSQASLEKLVEEFEDYIKTTKVINEDDIADWKNRFDKETKGDFVLRDMIYQPAMTCLQWFRKQRYQMYMTDLDKLKRNLKGIQDQARKPGAVVYGGSVPVRGEY